jgi:hypothetical protein
MQELNPGPWQELCQSVSCLDAAAACTYNSAGHCSSVRSVAVQQCLTSCAVYAARSWPRFPWAVAGQQRQQAEAAGYQASAHMMGDASSYGWGACTGAGGGAECRFSVYSSAGGRSGRGCCRGLQPAACGGLRLSDLLPWQHSSSWQQDVPLDEACDQACGAGKRQLLIHQGSTSHRVCRIGRGLLVTEYAGSAGVY